MIGREAALLVGLLAACAAPDAPPPPSPPEPVVVTSAPPASVDTPPQPDDALFEPGFHVDFSTRFPAGEAAAHRVHNIELVEDKLGEVELAPGAEFSFNGVVGPRTEEAGFESAPEIFLGETFQGIGGGTCQVSSTLYAAALHAGLEVVERRPHSRPSTYIAAGLDATVAFSAACASKLDPAVCYDLRLRNPYSFPVFLRVHASPVVREDGSRELTATVFGRTELEIPKVTSVWVTWNQPPYEKRTRRVSYWHNARTRLKQPGHAGLEGARHVTRTEPDGRVIRTKIVSRYKPVPEVWEVGMDWKEPE